MPQECPLSYAHPVNEDRFSLSRHDRLSLSRRRSELLCDLADVVHRGDHREARVVVAARAHSACAGGALGEDAERALGLSDARRRDVYGGAGIGPGVRLAYVAPETADAHESRASWLFQPYPAHKSHLIKMFFWSLQEELLRLRRSH